MNATNANYKPAHGGENLDHELMFQSTATALLVAIANGQVDAIDLARRELFLRGLSQEKGMWVGMAQAEHEYEQTIK